MSDKTPKRSRAAGSAGAKPKRARSSAAKPRDGKKDKKRAKSTGPHDRSTKKRKTVGGDKPKRTKSTAPSDKPKRVKSDAAPGADGGAVEPKPVKISARKIEVKFTPRKVYGVRTQPYRRLLNHYAHQVLKDMRMAHGVDKSIQAVVDEVVIEMLRQASVVAMHAKRNTVNANDIALQARLATSKSGDSEDLVAWAKKLAAKQRKPSASKGPRKAGARPAKPATPGDATAAPADGTAAVGSAATAGDVAAKPKKARKTKKPAGDGAAGGAGAAADGAAQMDALMPPMVAPVA